MTAGFRPGPSFSVVKIGGGLTRIPGALARVCSGVAAAALGHRLLVVPGGGPFADAVREFDGRVGISADAAHWMAILAMDQYAHVLADHIPGAVLFDDPRGAVEVMGSGKVVVLAPSRWLRSADALPHSWEVTSDSIAAYVAGALAAERLVLIKPVEGNDAVDAYFRRALPASIPCLILSWERIDELGSRLSG